MEQDSLHMRETYLKVLWCCESGLVVAAEVPHGEVPRPSELQADSRRLETSITCYI